MKIAGTKLIFVSNYLYQHMLMSMRKDDELKRIERGPNYRNLSGISGL